MAAKLALLIVAGVGLLATLGCSEEEERLATGSEASTDAATPNGQAFQGDGYSFMYPDDWAQVDEIFNPDPTPDADYVGISPTDPQSSTVDLFTIGLGDVTPSVTASNIDEVAIEVTANIEQQFAEIGGAITAGPTRLTVGGLPALSYETTGPPQYGPEAQSRAVFIFDGTTMYASNCQWTPGSAEEMARGCDQILASFQVD